MWLFNFFRKKKRDRIGANTIRRGSVLKVYPASRSHVSKPYLVRVIMASVEAFTTELVHPEEHPDPHIFTFVYRSEDWEYHRNRFKIVKK
jgi:hypothetical protein